LDFDGGLSQQSTPNFGKILSSIFLSNKLASETFLAQQKDVMSRIDDLNGALKSITRDVGSQVRNLGSLPVSVPQPPPQPKHEVQQISLQPDKDCAEIMTTLLNLQKILDKAEKESNKKISDFKNEIRTVSSQLVEQTSGSTQLILAWLNFGILVSVVAFLIVRESLKVRERSKKFF